MAKRPPPDEERRILHELETADAEDQQELDDLTVLQDSEAPEAAKAVHVDIADPEARDDEWLGTVHLGNQKTDREILEGLPDRAPQTDEPDTIISETVQRPDIEIPHTPPTTPQDAGREAVPPLPSGDTAKPLDQASDPEIQSEPELRTPGPNGDVPVDDVPQSDEQQESVIVTEPSGGWGAGNISTDDDEEEAIEALVQPAAGAEPGSTNEPPVAGDDEGAAEEDGSVTIDVLSNDIDSDSDTLSVTGVALENGVDGTVAINADNTISFVPGDAFDQLATDEVQTVTITYTVSDGAGGTDTGAVIVTVTGTNDGPIARADLMSTEEGAGVIIDVLANDTDVDSATITVTDATTDMDGTVVVNADNTITFVPERSFLFLESGESQDVTITYTIADDQGDTDTSTATVTVVGEGQTLDFPWSLSGELPEEITITGIPTGVELSSGTRDADGAWVLGTDELANLRLAFNTETTDPFDVTVTTWGKAGREDTSASADISFAPDVEGAWAPSHSLAITGGTSQADTLTGTIGIDLISGLDRDDSISGGDGDDLLFGHGGDDQLYGDAGDDTLSGGDGKDTLRGGEGADTLYGGVKDDQVYGDAGDDTLYGNAGRDQLYGGEGNDVLDGGAGRDTAYGGAGDDTFVAGDGNDTFYGDAGNDLFIFGPGGGRDTFIGGDGDWTNSVQLEGVTGTFGDDANWTLRVPRNVDYTETEEGIVFEENASGTIKFDDGSELDFEDVSEIVW